MGKEDRNEEKGRRRKIYVQRSKKGTGKVEEGRKKKDLFGGKV